MDGSMSKDKARLELKRILADQLDDMQRTQKSEKACRNLIASSEFNNASVIMMYVSMPQEVDTSQAILKAWQSGKKVVVPKIYRDQKYMIPVQIDSFDFDFSVEFFGLRNPIEDKAVALEEIDLIVIPALGFDRQANRLGRGAGYYDRFLASDRLHAKRAGLAFSEQLLESLPVTETDQKMDLLITDEEVIYF